MNECFFKGCICSQQVFKSIVNSIYLWRIQKSEHKFDIFLPRLMPDQFWSDNPKQQDHLTIDDANSSANGFMSMNFIDEKLKEGKKIIDKVFESPLLNNLFQNIRENVLKPHMEENLTHKKESEKQQTNTPNGERNQLKILNILLKQKQKGLKEDLQICKKKVAQIKQQATKEKEDNHLSIKTLKAQLNEANQLILSLKAQVKQKDSQIKQERIKLYDALTPFLKKQEKKDTNQFANIQWNFQDILTSIEQLGQQLKNKIKEHEKEIQFVKNDFERIILNLEDVKTKDYVHPQFVSNQTSFFSKTVGSLKRNRLQLQEKLKVPIYYEKIIKLMELVEDKNKIILSDWNEKLASAHQKIKSLETERNGIVTQLEQKNLEYANLQRDLSNTKQHLEGKIIKLQKEKNALQNQTRQFNDGITKLNQQIDKLSKDFKVKEDGLTTQLKQKQTQLVKKQQQITTCNTTIGSLNNTIYRMKAEIQSQKTTIDSLNNQASKMNQKIKNLQAQLDDTRKNGKASQTQNQAILRQNQNKIVQLKSEIDKVNRANKDQQVQIKEIQKSLTSKNQQLQRQQRQNYELRQIQKQMESHITELQRKPKFVRCYEHYFNGNILSCKKPKQIELFANHIEALMEKKIISTKLLYHDDRYNNNSYHNYVDGIPNIALLVTFNGGQIIGGFSEAAYQKSNINCDFKKGLMLEFTNGKVFHTKQKRENSKGNKTISRPVSYDEFYIIWGNSDLRIKPPTPQARDIDLQFHSFYGTANSCYQEKGNPNSCIDDLFNTKNRHLTFERFQIFEVIFEQSLS